MLMQVLMAYYLNVFSPICGSHLCTPLCILTVREGIADFCDIGKSFFLFQGRILRTDDTPV